MLDVTLAGGAALLAIMLVTGAIGGVIAGLLGVGGGIVIVPVLFVVLGFVGVDPSVIMHVAVATSLATILFTGTMSARSHWKKGSVDTALLRAWAPAITIGVLAGAALGARVDGLVLTLVFAVVAALVALNMVLKSSDGAEGDDAATRLPGTPVKEGLGGLIGLVSVMMGIGGGTLSVPILSYFSYPIRKAVGTAAAIGLIIAVPGTLGYVWSGLGVADRPPFSLGYVNIIGVLAIIPASMATAPLGAKLAHTISPKALRYSFALFLALTSLNMLRSVFA